MKNISQNLFIFLFILSFIKITFEDACKYKKDTSEVVETTSEYFENLKEDEQKQKCFSLSHSNGNDRCCYDTSGKVCTSVPDNINDSRCPKDTGVISNNCGMAGIYQPETSEICTEISLVEGYCCYVKDNNSGNTACVRTKKLNKNKNSATGQMLNYIKRCTKKYLENHSTETVDFNGFTVICNEIYLKYFLKYIIFVLILLF